MNGATRIGATTIGAMRIGATRIGATRIGATRIGAMRMIGATREIGATMVNGATMVIATIDFAGARFELTPYERSCRPMAKTTWTAPSLPMKMRTLTCVSITARTVCRSNRA